MNNIQPFKCIIEYLMIFIQFILSINVHNVMIKAKAKCKSINKSRPDLKIYI